MVTVEVDDDAFVAEVLDGLVEVGLVDAAYVGHGC